MDKWHPPEIVDSPPKGSEVQLWLGQFFDVHVFVGDDLDRTHETRGTVNVPHPRVSQREFKENIPTNWAGLNIDLIAEVETAFGFDHILK